MIDPVAFPNLSAANHRVTSPPTTTYNCVAWAAGDTTRWWQPGRYWPIATDSTGVAEMEAIFAAIGFEHCLDGVFELGYEKVALFGVGRSYSHAARQLQNGKWTSKLGRAEDIEHESPEDLAGGMYGNVATFMRRANVQPKD